MAYITHNHVYNVLLMYVFYTICMYICMYKTVYNYVQYICPIVHVYDVYTSTTCIIQ